MLKFRKYFLTLDLNMLSDLEFLIACGSQSAIRRVKNRDRVNGESLSQICAKGRLD